MNMPSVVVAGLTAAVSMLVIDAVWLWWMTPHFYQKYIGHLLAPTPAFGAAALFYPLYIVGLAVLVLQPALRGEWPLWQGALMGALYGLVTYGTYDFTNHATLKDWPWQVTLVDIVWGAALTGVVTLIALWIAR